MYFTNIIYVVLSNSYTMGCPPVRGDNPRALAMDNPWYNCFIPPTSVEDLAHHEIFHAKVVKGGIMRSITFLGQLT